MFIFDLTYVLINGNVLELSYNVVNECFFFNLSDTFLDMFLYPSVTTYNLMLQGVVVDKLNFRSFTPVVTAAS